MLSATSPRKKLRSPGQELVLNPKTSITCLNVPEGLFDATTAKQHFSKFGRVQRIRLFPKRSMSIIEYDQPSAAERAVLNAGAFDGFMFDVSRVKPKVRRRSKKEDDPDWVPDSDVEEELSAMSGAPSYRVPRQKPMNIEPDVNKVKTVTRITKQSPIKKKLPVREKPVVSQPVSGIESPVLIPVQSTTMSTFEAAAELHQLRSKVSMTPDEQWRILDARDRILRAWGGAGSRVKVGGATIGTCPDMCPEKELLHRQAEHQVMTLETYVDSDGQLEPWRAVKQYSRSSADQEIPMCYELRSAPVLLRTCAYLLHEIADTNRQVSLADWFHFMWDRFRGIRKDITQQALCCAESIQLVEMCARFHAHCAARLADLEHTQFDQKLNTDNLTKCLQTLKHMYTDVDAHHKPREAEFRGYVALLNLGDANFWWEIKQLPEGIQKSEPITFAIQIFNALDNNNYVRFFRLITDKATYLQACILLRYFNDVRARALARMVKAYAPRGGSRYPAMDMMKALAFESIENMKSFINHYGLRFAKSDEYELSIILDRNQFIEDSDPYPISRAVQLIESKRQCTVGEVIAGGTLPKPDFGNHTLYSSFNKDGRLKEAALTAEDQGYNTVNDSNKDVKALKAEINRLSQGGKSYDNIEKHEPKGNLFVTPEVKTVSPKASNPFATPPSNSMGGNKLFLFKPAIPVAPKEIIENSPEKIFSPETKNIFSFSKPQDTVSSNIFGGKETGNLFTAPKPNNLFVSKPLSDTNNIFNKGNNENKDPFQTSQSLFSNAKADNDNVFKKPDIAKSIFGQPSTESAQGDLSKNLFSNVANTNLFSKKSDETINENAFAKNIFSAAKEGNLFAKPDSTMKFEKGGNIFAKAAPIPAGDDTKRPSNIFGTFEKPTESKNIFSKPDVIDGPNKSVFTQNGDIPKITSPGSLFKSAINPPNGPDSKSYSIFQSKNKAQTVADNILNSVSKNETVYDFNEEEAQKQATLQRLNEEKIKEEERRIQENLRQEELKRQELQRQEEEKRKEEARKKQEELRQLEEKRKKEEEKKQEELRRKLEEERKAELIRKAQEEEKRFKERVEKESTELIEVLIDEVNNEINREILKEEQEKLRNLMKYANEVSDSLLNDLCKEIVAAELKADKFRYEKLSKKWFYIWRKQYFRNINRRRVLEDTPVWLTDRTPVDEASHLRRLIEQAALKNMNAIHRGYIFTGELRQPPPPEPYNIMEIIRSPLLKRMKQICYPYDKCFFWKVTLVSPGANKWLCKKINMERWLIEAFSDKHKHDESDSLLQVTKQSWNHLMDFAIAVSLTSKEKSCNSVEALEGTNGVLFYANENDHNLVEIINETLKYKYPYQVVPVAVITHSTNTTANTSLQELLNNYISKNIISAFKIFIIDPQNVPSSLNLSTKSALKWLAKKFPQTPPLEIDFLKSICQRYLGNEVWCRFRTERDGRMNMVLKDLNKLIKCYNIAVDKLTEVITDEDLFNYPSFPLEFKVYLNNSSPYPKPYEFIPSNVKNSENVSTIKDIMKQLKLPDTSSSFNPMSAVSMQQQIRKYCNQIGWFENPEQVVCKVVAVLPNELSDITMPHEDFTQYFAQYDLIDFLNIIVYEKINMLNRFDNRFAIYKKTVLQEYCTIDWLYEINVIREIKHKALEYDDELDFYIEAKRRKIELDSLEYLMLEDKDKSLVEESIKEADESITKYSNCSEAVKQLEMEIEEGKKKSVEFENMLQAALSNV